MNPSLTKSNKIAFPHIHKQLSLGFHILPSTPPFVHCASGTHPQQRFLDVIAQIPLLQHTDPEVVVFQQVEILIASYSLYGTFFVHDTGVIEWISLFGKLEDFLLSFGDNPAACHVMDISIKFFHNAADQAVLWMFSENLQLLFTAFRTAYIIRIHPGHQFILALFQTSIQCFSQASIFFQPMDMENGTELLLHLFDDSIQFRCQRSVADQDKVTGRYRLMEDAFHALLEVLRSFFIIDRHKDRILLTHSFSPAHAPAPLPPSPVLLPPLRCCPS